MALNWAPKQNELARAANAADASRYASARPWIVDGLALSAGTGLNVAISAGTAWINGYVVDWDASAQHAVTGSATNHVYLKLTRDGNDNVTAVAFEINTTGTPPAADFVKLGTATTNGSSVTGTATTGRSPEAQVAVVSVFGRDGAVVAASGDYEADEIDYDNATSGLAATDVQGAIDEVAARPQAGGWDGINVRSTDLSKNNSTFATMNSFSAAANKTYAVEGMFFINNNTGLSKMQITVPSGATADISVVTILDAATFGATTLQSVLDLAASSSFSTDNGYGNMIVHYNGIVTISSTAGTVAVQVANQSGALATVFKAGASLKWKDIT